MVFKLWLLQFLRKSFRNSRNQLIYRLPDFPTSGQRQSSSQGSCQEWRQGLPFLPAYHQLFGLLHPNHELVQGFPLNIWFRGLRKKSIEYQSSYTKSSRALKATEISLREVSTLGIFMLSRLLRKAITVIITLNTQSKTAAQNMANWGTDFHQNNVILLKEWNRC